MISDFTHFCRPAPQGLSAICPGGTSEREAGMMRNVSVHDYQGVLRFSWSVVGRERRFSHYYVLCLSASGGGSPSLSLAQSFHPEVAALTQQLWEHIHWQLSFKPVPRAHRRLSGTILYRPSQLVALHEGFLWNARGFAFWGTFCTTNPGHALDFSQKINTLRGMS